MCMSCPHGLYILRKSAVSFLRATAGRSIRRENERRNHYDESSGISTGATGVAGALPRTDRSGGACRPLEVRMYRSQAQPLRELRLRSPADNTEKNQRREESHGRRQRITVPAFHFVTAGRESLLAERKKRAAP